MDRLEKERDRQAEHGPDNGADRQPAARQQPGDPGSVLALIDAKRMVFLSHPGQRFPPGWEGLVEQVQLEDLFVQQIEGRWLDWSRTLPAEELAELAQAGGQLGGQLGWRRGAADQGRQKGRPARRRGDNPQASSPSAGPAADRSQAEQ